MPASVELLKNMEPAHAINALRADFNPIANTELEAYLIDWAEALIETVETAEPVLLALDSLDSTDMDAEDLKPILDAVIGDAANTVAILDVVSAAGFESPEALKDELTLAKGFRDFAKDAPADFFARLNTLITEVKETDYEH